MRRTLYGALALALVLLAAWAVGAWESHPLEDENGNPLTDENGDVRFGSEHVSLTADAMDAVNAFAFLGDRARPATYVFGEVRDFNAVELGWDTLRTRTFYPVSFAELPDFFYSMEDYINQRRRCPPLNDWNTVDCHSFEHFMGALNSSHFPPQTRLNYERYHQIAQAVLALGNTLQGDLLVADALGEYGSYFEECRLEALTYEAIAQHYLQDQWAMGHMWHRWGGPDVADFQPSGVFAPFRDWRNGQLVYGKVIGAVSGMIHGWKSTVESILGQYLSDDAMSYYTEGVEWVRSDLPEPSPGLGDLFLPDMWSQPQFDTQRLESEACYEESIRQVIGFDVPESEINPLCWDNYATNRAMNIGLNWSPSAAASLVVSASSGIDTGVEALDVIIHGAALEMASLSALFAWAAFWYPDDTFLAEGYTSPSRTQRLTLFGIEPNDAYARVPSYMDPAREAPGDPADRNTRLPESSPFGVRQVRYFNRCHTQYYCDHPEILNDYRDRCRAANDGSREVECQICEDLAARFFVGEPPLCEILAAWSHPDSNDDNPPNTIGEVSRWCRSDEEPEPEPEPTDDVGTEPPPECNHDGVCDEGEICDACRVDCAEPASTCGSSDSEVCGTCFEPPACPRTIVAYVEDPPYVLTNEQWGTQFGARLTWECDYSSSSGGSSVSFCLRWIESSQASVDPCEPLCEDTTYTTTGGAITKTVGLNSESRAACAEVCYNRPRAAFFDDLLSILRPMLALVESQGLPCH